MKKEVPPIYRRHLRSRSEPLLESRHRLTWRGFCVGSFLSFFLAISAPYSNMVIKGAYVAADISTPGAIFVFVVLIGILNLAFKLAARSKGAALAFAVALGAAWLYAYWPLSDVDAHSPGLIFSTFALICALANVPLAWSGRSLALNRADLIMVYAMLAMVSAVCTMGLTELILPSLTAIFYYASPENQWREKLFPHFPDHNILVDDGAGNALFYEGISKSGQSIPYGAWVEPLMWWAVFLLALYVCMISIAVILRRQWMERERLSYPIAQAGLAMIRGEEEKGLVNGFFKRPSVWIGMAVPFIAGSLRAMSNYDSSIPMVLMRLPIPYASGKVDFALTGFAYLIDTRISGSLWVFYLLGRIQKSLLATAGIKSEQVLQGVHDAPLVGYEGLGALLVLVAVVLWTAREHLKAVWLKALGRAPRVDDRDEILSYRGAVIGAFGGIAVMTLWLWTMGTPLWVSLFFIVLAMAIFIGITRIIAEAGLATLRTPVNAPDFVVMGLGSSLVGPTGVFNLSMAYIWANQGGPLLRHGDLHERPQADRGHGCAQPAAGLPGSHPCPDDRDPGLLLDDLPRRLPLRRRKPRYLVLQPGTGQSLRQRRAQPGARRHLLAGHRLPVRRRRHHGPAVPGSPAPAVVAPAPDRLPDRGRGPDVLHHHQRVRRLAHQGHRPPLRRRQPLPPHSGGVPGDDRRSDADHGSLAHHRLLHRAH